jgi:hypothetical protein
VPQLRQIGRLALAALALAAAAPAGALTLSNLTVTNASTSVFDDEGPIGAVAESSASVGPSGAGGFEVQYAAVLGADTGGAGGGDFTQDFVGAFTLRFEVTESAGTSWVVRFDVERGGELAIVSDGSGFGTVTLDGLGVVHAGAGALVGSLDLAPVGTLSNALAPGDSPVQPFLQTASAVVAGVGTGAAELVTLTFTFAASVSTLDVPGGFVQGDEAALRMGMEGGLLSFTADDDAGALGTDGIRVTATVPEPGAEILLALGLIGLGWFDRRRSQKGAAGPPKRGRPAKRARERLRPSGARPL